MFVNEAQIKAREIQDLKDRQAKRAKAKAKAKAKASFASTSIFNTLAVPKIVSICATQYSMIGRHIHHRLPCIIRFLECKLNRSRITPLACPCRHSLLETNTIQVKNNASKKKPRQQQQRTEASTSAEGGFKRRELTTTRSDPAIKADAAVKDRYQSVDAGVDLSQAPLATGVDEAGARTLCSWLNANVCTTYIEV